MSTLITTTAQIGTIKDAGGNATAMTIDSAGRILTPARPSFRAKPSSTTTVAANNDIVYGDVTTSGFGLHNIGAHYNTSNGIFTAPIAGVYFFAFNCYQNNTSDCEVDLFIGSQAIAVGRNFSDGASYDSLEVSTNILLSAGDQVKVRVVNGTAYVNTSVSSFSGFLIG